MSKRNRGEEVARMVELMEKIGPNINKIARLSGQYKESVRYRYREKTRKEDSVSKPELITRVLD